MRTQFRTLKFSPTTVGPVIDLMDRYRYTSDSIFWFNIEPDVDEQSVSMNDRSKVRTISAEHRRKGKFRQAKVEILSLTADGAIDEIVIRDRGFGYDTDPNRKPKVWIIQILPSFLKYMMNS